MKIIKTEGCFEVPDYYDTSSFVSAFIKLLENTSFYYNGGFHEIKEDEAATEKGKTNEF